MNGGGPALDFEVRQEADEVSSRKLLGVGIASILIGALGVFFAGVILVATVGTLQPSEAGPQGPRPAPRTLSHIEQTPIWQSQVGLDLRDAQRRDLESWGWVDRRAGVAKIPIERAMDIVAKEASR
jgi:hypothetical protein